MNKLTYYILSAILSVLFFSSCSDDEKAVPAAATLNAIKATSHCPGTVRFPSETGVSG